MPAAPTIKENLLNILKKISLKYKKDIKINNLSENHDIER